MDLLCINPLNYWELLKTRQSVTKPYRKVMEGSTTIRKEYTQVSGNGGHSV